MEKELTLAFSKWDKRKYQNSKNQIKLKKAARQFVTRENILKLIEYYQVDMTQNLNMQSNGTITINHVRGWEEMREHVALVLQYNFTKWCNSEDY